MDALTVDRKSASEVQGISIHPSTCWECSTLCGSLITVKNERVTHIGPNSKHDYSKGAFCLKGINGLTGVAYHKNRVLHPLRRKGPRGSGEWERISWPDAANEIADNLARVTRQHGALSLAGAVSGAFVGRGLTMALFLRSLGSPNWMINQDLCGGCRAISSKITGLDIMMGEDIDHARCALVVGRNPPAANPVEWKSLKELKRRGGRIVLIDPKRTPVVQIADLWLRPRLGTDAAIALAMMQVMIEEELVDRQFVERWCLGYPQLKERVSRYEPKYAEILSGVPAKDIIAAARLYADGPSTFVSGHGIDAFNAGVQTFRAFHCLVAISGNVDRIGGNRRIKRPRGFRDYMQILKDPAFRLPSEIEQKTIGASRFPLWAGPDGWQQACHNPSVITAILTGDPYPIRAMYVSGVNIVVTYPNTKRTIEALRSLDFLFVATHMMTPTAQLADIVLPKTTGVEEEEVSLMPAGPVITYTAAAVQPEGEARCDLDIALSVLDRMTAQGALHKNYFPWRTQREFNEYLLGDSGISFADLRNHGFASFDYELGNFDAHPFPTPSGKIELYSPMSAQMGLDPLPDFVTPEYDRVEPDISKAYPLILITGDREKTYHHSRFREQAWAKKVSPEPRLQMNPKTAARLSMKDGQWVRLETSALTDACHLRLVVTDTTPVNVVSTGMGWWNTEAKKPEHSAFDINVNAALSYEGPWDPASGSANVRGIRCRVIAVERNEQS